MSAVWSTPARYVAEPGVSAADDIVDNARVRPDHPAFARLVDGTWQSVTSKQFLDEVTSLASGLIAAGIGPGDRVGLMSSTRYEWTLCDFAIWTAGAISVPIYETSPPAQAEWILNDSGAVAVFAENDRCAAVLDAAATSPGLRRWQLDRDLDRLAAAGRTRPAAELAERRRMVGATTPATIVYTSGTTGRPKGCVLTHGNLVAEIRNVARADGVADGVLTEHSSLLLFLPLAHILARMVALVAVHNGTQLAHTSDLAGLADELPRYRPTIILGVPRVFEKLYDTARFIAVTGGHRHLFRAAESTAVAYSRSLETGRPGLPLRVAHRLFDRLVYAKVRATLGGRARHACSGGAPLGVRLGHFFRGCGVTVLEGWGLTETTSGTTLNLPAFQRIGTVGRPLPGCAVRVDADGEVLVKGPNVFAGYWRDAAATAGAFDTDGWLRTGDLGELDDGYLRITGRKKDLIVTASGKNVAPAPLEDRVRAHWLVGDCVVIGEARPYVAALVTLDPDGFARWKRQQGLAAAHGVAELLDHPNLVAEIQTAVDEANRTVSTAEGVRKFRVLAEPFQVGAELTPSQKVRREYVRSKLRPEIDELYAR
ncbi:AMP-dependent synthetase/ligase [Paractinoplanes hotanensis]|uniref:Long-chain fatty acid--CoA ligase n=1 Tax=Paractinoplanes hotanensis TaxID=2906497 RepID=A0ABT0YE75_9ACTN|nr:long-chain fatty acid--CoA ligase [Actinoplanes hotanensis]MCM4084354.1 long-chain fatty acid--CoA ligase [Actinoplanes hotanensis]